MADDPYQVLNVARGASQAEIRNAFLKLAKKYHPDLNPGNRKAEERFKKLNAAHAKLSTRSDAAEVGPDDMGFANAAAVGMQQRTPIQLFFINFGLGFANIFVTIFKAVDTVLGSIWTGVKILFAMK